MDMSEFHLLSKFRQAFETVDLDHIVRDVLQREHTVSRPRKENKRERPLFELYRSAAAQRNNQERDKNSTISIDFMIGEEPVIKNSRRSVVKKQSRTASSLEKTTTTNTSVSCQTPLFWKRIGLKDYMDSQPSFSGTQDCKVPQPGFSGTKDCEVIQPGSFGTKDCKVSKPGSSGTKDCEVSQPASSGTKDCDASQPGSSGTKYCEVSLPGSSGTKDCEVSPPESSGKDDCKCPQPGPSAKKDYKVPKPGHSGTKTYKGPQPGSSGTKDYKVSERGSSGTKNFKGPQSGSSGAEDYIYPHSSFRTQPPRCESSNKIPASPMSTDTNMIPDNLEPHGTLSTLNKTKTEIPGMTREEFVEPFGASALQMSVENSLQNLNNAYQSFTIGQDTDQPSNDCNHGIEYKAAESVLGVQDAETKHEESGGSDLDSETRAVERTGDNIRQESALNINVMEASVSEEDDIRDFSQKGSTEHQEVQPEGHIINTGKFRGSDRLFPDSLCKTLYEKLLTIGEEEKKELEELKHVLVKAKEAFSTTSPVSKQAELLEAQTQAREDRDRQGITGRESGVQQYLLDTLVSFLEEKVVETVRFAKCIPGFKELDLQDQISLIKDNNFVHILLGLFRCTSVECRVVSFFPTSHVGFEEVEEIFSKEFGRVLRQSPVKAKETNATDEEEMLMEALLMTLTEDCPSLKERTKIDAMNRKILLCLLHVLSFGSVPVLERMDQLASLMLYCMQASEEHKEFIKNIILQSPKYADNATMIEVL